MFKIKYLYKLRTFRSLCQCQTIVNNRIQRTITTTNCFNKNKEIDNKPRSLGPKYKEFQDKDSEIIWDIYEQRQQESKGLSKEVEEKEVDEFEGLNLERGYYGVYDIEDLVDVLRKENAKDIFVASVPKELKYVDYIVLVSGKSVRHLHALAEFVRRVYKKKMNKNDHLPRIEGGKSQDWLAIDLGNIALHIFSKEARALYDLDTLWSVGPKFDREYQKEDPISEMLEKHSIYLKDFQPAS